MDGNEYRRKVAESDPDNVGFADLSPEQLEEYLHYFEASLAKPDPFEVAGVDREITHRRIAQLKVGIAASRRDKHSDSQHQESMTLGRWTLGFAAASLLVGIVAVCQQRANKQTSTPAPSPSDIRPATSPSPQISPSQPTPQPTVAPTATAMPAATQTAAPSQSPLLSPTR